MLSWKNSRFTVVNANNTFCNDYAGGDSFIKAELEKRNINVEYGLKLVEIKKESNTAIFENIKTGQKSERPYHNLYSLFEQKADTLLADAGLAASNGLLNVDKFTLQHNKFSNIFGFGDVANLPTSKTFYAGFSQLHVVRHNVERALNNFNPNAKYDGYSNAFMHTGLDSSVNVSHFYDGKPDGALDTGFMGGLRYKMADHGKKDIINLLKFKSWGPPYHKWKKTFDGGDSKAASTPANMQPAKKTA